MSTADAYNFKLIDASVSTSGVMSPENLACLSAEGFDAVINLMPDSSDYAVEGEQSLVEQQGVAYHYIPVDFAAPNREDYLNFADTLRGLAGQKTMIHCAANYRVSAFYAIYAVHNLGWSEATAREHIHSIWDPAEHPPWQRFVDEALSADSWAGGN